MMAETLLLLRLTILAALFNSSVSKPADSSRLRLFETIWKVLDDIVPVLRPLAAATQLLSAEKTPTITQVYIILRSLLFELDVSESKKGMIKDRKKQILRFSSGDLL